MSTPSSPSLKNQALSSLIFVSLSKAVKVGCSFGSLVILTRLLSPSDFGIIAMVTPVLVFIGIFQGMGIVQATVHHDDLTDHERRALFTVAVLSGLGIAALLVLCAPLIAAFYRNEQAGYVLAASGLVAIVTGLGLQHKANLNRDLKFKHLSMIETVSSLGGLAAGIAFALIIGNYWAIWLSSLSSALITLMGIRLADSWRPHLNFDFRSAKKLLNFGQMVAASQFLAFLSRNADNVILGRMATAAMLGQYSRAYQLVVFPLQNVNMPISQVFLPVLSRKRHDMAAYRAIYLKIIGGLSMAMVAPLLVVAYYATSVTLYLFGPGWDPAGEMLMWLALTVSYQVVTSTNGLAFISLGKPEAMFNWSKFGAPFTVCCFLIGAQWGAQGVAISYFVAETVKTPILLKLISHHAGIPYLDLVLAYLPSAVAGAVAILLSHLVFGPALPSFLVLVVVLAITIFLSGAANCLLPRHRRVIAELIAYARSKIPGLARRSA